MARMVGTGRAPQGYLKGQVFDVPENDIGTMNDLERKGWAKRLDPRDDPGRTEVQIANAIVRGDSLMDPVDRTIAHEIGWEEEAHAIVHLEDPKATPKDYEKEADEGRTRNAIGQPLSEAEVEIQKKDQKRIDEGFLPASSARRLGATAGVKDDPKMAAPPEESSSSPSRENAPRGAGAKEGTKEGSK